MKAIYLKEIIKYADFNQEDETIISAPGKVRKVNAKPISYTERHRGVWFKPEYNLDEIQIAQDTDGYLFRAIKKKVNRFLTAGWEIVGEDPEVVKYIKKRISEIEYVSKTPWNLLLTQTATDLFRFSNCMWVKARSEGSSSGSKRKIFEGAEVEPVAGYFVLPFETLAFKTKRNGEIKKIRQKMPSGDEKYFSPNDVIHFYENKKPGFAMGTPEIVPVLDDIALLRRLEENVEDLIESNLYPLFHYTVGSDSMPERYSPEGYKETDIVKNTIDYMPAGGIYVSDHRHKITAIGSEGRALRIEGYLDYFKKRVIAGLGLSSVDMGEGDTANRSTANALSQSAIQDVEALQFTLKTFIEFFVFNELLLEGGYDPLESSNKVEIKFGVVDREARGKLENQTVQLFLNNLISENEARQRLGMPPEVDKEDTHYSLYTLPLAELKVFGPKVQPEKNSEKNTSENISMPENQHGKRMGPKYSSDENVEEIELFLTEVLDKQNISDLEYNGVLKNKENLISNYIADINGIKQKLTEFAKNNNINDIVLKEQLDIYISKINEEYKKKVKTILETK